MRILRVCRTSIEVFALGDFLVLFAFVIVGEFSHGALPWNVPLMVAETTLTFVVGWVAVAPLVWAYQRQNLSSPKLSAVTGFVAWVGASAIANLLRSTQLVHGSSAVTFFLVAAGMGGAMIAGWRYQRARTIASTE